MDAHRWLPSPRSSRWVHDLRPIGLTLRTNDETARMDRVINPTDAARAACILCAVLQHRCLYPSDREVIPGIEVVEPKLASWCKVAAASRCEGLILQGPAKTEF